jgi:hypothetical protein
LRGLFTFDLADSLVERDDQVVDLVGVKECSAASARLK